MKTREEIQQEYERDSRAIWEDYWTKTRVLITNRNDNLHAAEVRRDAALAELDDPMARHEANARLIAAAPDLLAAVEGVIADVIVTKDNGDRMCIVCMAYFDADAREPQAHVTYCPIPALTAAIKKAKGQL